MSYCTFYIKANENPSNLEDLKGRIASNSLEDKVKAMKELIKSIISDESYPTMIMHIITNVIPNQHKSQ
jgi:vesicle coat complex subunit